MEYFPYMYVPFSCCCFSLFFYFLLDVAQTQKQSYKIDNIKARRPVCFVIFYCECINAKLGQLISEIDANVG